MKNTDPKGYYAILGVPPNADAAAIKEAFRRRAMDLHPDRNKSPDATRMFQLLNAAYGVLSDPAARARYDTITLARDERATQEPPEPIVCSCCGKMTAQPRYVIFYEVKSFLLLTTRSPIQGIFCSTCAERKALKATGVTWVLGWWGFPWGLVYSFHAIFNNLAGGKQPAEINARLLAYQAWAFAVRGKNEMARAIALDALKFAKKVEPDQASVRAKKALGYEVRDEGMELRAQIDKLVQAMGPDRQPRRLKNAWGLFGRLFYVQGAMAAVVIGSISYWIYSQPPYSPPKGPKQYVATPQSSRAPMQNSKYVHPAAAPNGEPWPSGASYIQGYAQIHKNGYSTITVDNSQNDSDVFGKLVSLDGATAFPVRTFFIPARGSFTMESVTQGSYDVRYRDLNTGRLSRSQSFSLEETQSYEGVRFSNLTMTLYKVRNGNMQTYSLAEDEF